MDAVFAPGTSKAGLITDEYDPPGLGDSSHGNQSIAPGGHYGKRGSSSSTIFYETLQQFQRQSLSGGSGQVLSGGPKSYNFEIEPDHLDFSAGSSFFYSKSYSGDCGSRSSGFTTGDFSVSSAGHSIPSFDVAGNPHFGSNARNSSLSRVELQRPSRGESTGNRISLPVPANYSWREVVEMIGRATLEEGDADLNKRGIPPGTGSFDIVYKGMLARNRKEPLEPVTVKILGVGTDPGDREFLNEVNLLSELNYNNLVKLLGYCYECSHRVLVYKHAHQGSIHDHIHGTGLFLDWKKRLKIVVDSARGLQYLHAGCSPRIIHHGMKSSNIFLTEDWVAKVAGFGLSRIDNPGSTETEKLDEKTDIYSFGMLLLELITGFNPNNVEDWVHWLKKQSLDVGPVPVDLRLGQNYNPESMKEVQDLALACIDKLPDIETVVLVLSRIAMETE